MGRGAGRHLLLEWPVRASRIVGVDQVEPIGDLADKASGLIAAHLLPHTLDAALGARP
ncbi:hypothetical protein [Actinacidiphila glaucinigra]|uniref:hypothetical protein n=1 Tax=Actinacidiphila glaucinigra TaxID=235986 RepID=UPI0036E9474D